MLKGGARCKSSAILSFVVSHIHHPRVKFLKIDQFCMKIYKSRAQVPILKLFYNQPNGSRSCRRNAAQPANPRAVRSWWGGVAPVFGFNDKISPAGGISER
ncbi:hypothetical protein MN608_03936 [Microdochium nivale]|nr:hypothetical protein MN608_03936 [Microdochium nivale]